MPAKKRDGLTYNPLDLEEKDYKRLSRIYSMLKKVIPWDEAKHVRNRMNMDLHPMIALEVRYLARRYAVGQGYVVRKAFEALRDNGIKLDLERR